MPKINKSERDIGIVMKKNRKGVLEYYARVVKVNLNGTKQQILKKAKDKTDARGKLLDLQLEYRIKKENSFNDRMSFGELAVIYKKSKIKAAEFAGEGEFKRKVAGLRHVTNPARCLKTLISILGKKRLCDITPQTIEDYKEFRLGTPKENEEARSIASVNRELELLRAALNYAVRESILTENPFKKVVGVISKADEVQRDRVLSYEEEARLLGACDAEKPTTYKRGGRFGDKETTAVNMGASKKHLKPLIICALDCAMRRGELFKLRWTAVNLDENYIRVSQTISKTAKTRYVPITPRMNAILLELKAKRQSETDLVFGIEDNVKKSWRSLTNTAKVNGLRFHDLRHTSITRMVRSGIPIAEIMKISGHTQQATFLRYVNLTTETLTNVGEMLAKHHAANFPSQNPQEVLEVTTSSSAIN